jgi:hypothetical protein
MSIEMQSRVKWLLEILDYSFCIFCSLFTISRYLLGSALTYKVHKLDYFLFPVHTEIYDFAASFLFGFIKNIINLSFCPSTLKAVHFHPKTFLLCNSNLEILKKFTSRPTVKWWCVQLHCIAPDQLAAPSNFREGAWRHALTTWFLELTNDEIPPISTMMTLSLTSVHTMSCVCVWRGGCIRTNSRVNDEERVDMMDYPDEKIYSGVTPARVGRLRNLASWLGLGLDGMSGLDLFLFGLVCPFCDIPVSVFIRLDANFSQSLGFIWY